MSIFASERPLLVTCPKGIPPILSGELLSLGFPLLGESMTGVETKGTLRDAMALNLHLRTAHRVLLLLDHLRAAHPQQLYQGLTAIPWEEYVPDDGYVSVTSSVINPSITDSRFANLKGKDAIVDRIRERIGRRPDSGPRRRGTVIHLSWWEDSCKVYLDTSGEPLSRRGYRKIPLRAPMQETLAAAVVLATGWDGQGTFLNPMCGSGTLAIEAALIALNRAPGGLRESFGFMHLKGYDESSWTELREGAQAAARESFPGRIIATDNSPSAIEAARRNAAMARVEDRLAFGVCDYAQTPVPEGGGVAVINPEYGRRLGEISKLERIYQGIGDFFKNRCMGYRGYVFTGNLHLAKKVGLRTSRRIPLFNGDIECRLLEYELYQGSRKAREVV